MKIEVKGTEKKVQRGGKRISGRVYTMDFGGKGQPSSGGVKGKREEGRDKGQQRLQLVLFVRTISKKKQLGGGGKGGEWFEKRQRSKVLCA